MMEVRHHGQFYPACRGKCKPILEWMLGTGKENNPVDERLIPKTIYEDADIVVVCKPAGLLSVPGKSGQPSVESILSEKYGQVFMPHRLDQDTSGLMVAARTSQAYHNLQQQFLHRTVTKEYEALLDGIVCGEGVITLPLRPDLLDRPRQLVDHKHGRQATTVYKVIETKNGRTRVLLTPHTGRTHQLRVHCAHSEGLATPIVGDRLYGRSNPLPTERLCLHARHLSFTHPTTGQKVSFHEGTPF
jgi:tRNA pseudouridine32 synthase/23S rRNA pseudouridine746 synthase